MSCVKMNFHRRWLYSVGTVGNNTRQTETSSLDLLYDGHLGVMKMKAVARSYVWWPGIGQEIEDLAKSCSGCQAACSSTTTGSPNTSVGISHFSVATRSCGLCRSLYGQNVYGCC